MSSNSNISEVSQTDFIVVRRSDNNYISNVISPNGLQIGLEDDRFQGPLVSKGIIYAENGISGSLTRLTDGTSYLIAGSNVTITTGSSGAITIASSGGGGGGGASNIGWHAPSSGIISTTGSVYIGSADDSGSNPDITFGSDGATVFNENGNDADFRIESDNKTHAVFVDAGNDMVKIGSSTSPGPDSFFYVSGSIGGRGGPTKGVSVFGGDLMVSGGLYVDTLYSSGSFILSTADTKLPNSRVLTAGTGISISTATAGEIIINISKSKDVYSVTSSHAAGQPLVLSSVDFSDAGYHPDLIDVYFNGALVYSGSGQDYILTAGQTDQITFNHDLESDDLITTMVGAIGGASDTVGTFGTIAVSGQDNIVSDSTTDTLTFAAGSGITLTTDAASDTVTITASSAASEWTDGGTFLYPADNSGVEDLLLGNTTGSTANTVLYAGGSATFNQQAIGTGFFEIKGGSAGSTLFKASANVTKGNEQMLILSGGSAASLDVSNMSDVSFYVSGTIDSRGESSKGVALFGGDVVVSGSLSVNRAEAGVGSVFTITTDGKVGIGTDTPSYKLSVGGNMDLGEYLYHKNDADTFMRFESDKISFNAGGESLLTLTESTQDIVTVGDGGDVDFQVKTTNDDNTLFVQGSSDNVGIGLNNPSTTLHLKDSSPAIKLQREDNSETSGIQFAGSGGTNGAKIGFPGNTNDLLFEVFNGSTTEEILRLGDHYSTNNRQVIFLSGSDMHVGALQPRETADIAFFVSGSINSRGKAEKGTAVFGGDLVVSGNLRTRSHYYYHQLNATFATVRIQFWTMHTPGEYSTQDQGTVRQTKFICPASGSIDRIIVTPSKVTEPGTNGNKLAICVYKNQFRAAANLIPDFHVTGTTSNELVMQDDSGVTVTGYKGIFDFTGNTLFVTGSASNTFDPGDTLMFGGHSLDSIATQQGIMVVFKFNEIIDYGINEE